MNFDTTINLGHLITIAGIMLTAVLGYAALKYAVAALVTRSDLLDKRVESIASDMDTSAKEMKASLSTSSDKLDGRINGIINDLKKMTDVLVQIGRQEERLNAMDQRMLMQAARFDEQQGQLSRLRDDYIQLLAAKATRVLAAHSLEEAARS